MQGKPAPKTVDEWSCPKCSSRLAEIPIYNGELRMVGIHTFCKNRRCNYKIDKPLRMKE